jgi:DinB superfamily
VTAGPAPAPAGDHPPVCADCGFAWGDIPVASFGPSLTSLRERYAERLAAGEAELRRRPTPDVWSPLEYASHARDVLWAQRDRVYLTLVEVRPSFARMYREERVGLARYAEESPAQVRADLDVVFGQMLTALTGRSPEDWARRLIYNYPGPEEHDLAWLGRHTLHECEHHLVDIDRGLAATRP